MIEGRQTIVEVKVQIGIFQKYSFSIQQFIIALMPLNYVFRKYTGNFNSIKAKLNHLYTCIINQTKGKIK